MNFRTKIIYDIVQPRWPRLPVGLGHPQKRFSQLNYQQSAMMKTDAGTCAWSLSVSVLTTYSRLSNYFLPGLFDMALNNLGFLGLKNHIYWPKGITILATKVYCYLASTLISSFWPIWFFRVADIVCGLWYRPNLSITCRLKAILQSLPVICPLILTFFNI